MKNNPFWNGSNGKGSAHLWFCRRDFIHLFYFATSLRCQLHVWVCLYHVNSKKKTCEYHSRSPLFPKCFSCSIRAVVCCCFFKTGGMNLVKLSLYHIFLTFAQWKNHRMNKFLFMCVRSTYKYTCRTLFFEIYYQNIPLQLFREAEVVTAKVRS